jgi:hypothetical protein
MNQTNHPLHWYALWTRSRHEKYVRDQLAGKGIEPLLPLVKRKNRWKDRTKEVELPLFPGYCFARFFIEECLSVVKARGVVKVIGTDHRPDAGQNHPRSFGRVGGNLIPERQAQPCYHFDPFNSTIDSGRN